MADEDNFWEELAKLGLILGLFGWVLNSKKHFWIKTKKINTGKM